MNIRVGHNQVRGYGWELIFAAGGQNQEGNGGDTEANALKHWEHGKSIRDC